MNAGLVPISGYLICFVPLAVIVLGLVGFFVWTDRHAARPYPRYDPSKTPDSVRAAEPPK